MGDLEAAAPSLLTWRTLRTTPERRSTPESGMTNDTTTITSIVVHFGQLADPRRSLDRRHYLLDILTIALCAVISNADTWKDVE